MNKLIKNYLNYKLAYLGIYFIIAIYIIYVTIPSNLHIDNLLLIDSSVRLWFGQSPECLSWPSSPQLIFYSVVAFAHFLVTFPLSNLGLFFQNLETYYVNYYHNPYPLMYVVHVISILILFFTLYFILAKNKVLESTILLLLFVTSLGIKYEFVRYVGDVFGLVIAWFFIVKSNADNKNIIFLSLLAALAIDSRYFYIILIPYYFIKFSNNKEDKLQFVFLVSVFVLVLNPFLVTDTFLNFKAVIGNAIVKQGGKLSIQVFFNNIYTLFYSYGFIILCTLPIFFIKIGWAKNKTELVFFFIMCIPVLTSNNIFPRYFLPAILFLFVIAENSLTLINNLHKRIIAITLGVAFLIIWIVPYKTKSVNETQQIISFAETHQKNILALPISLERYFTKDSTYYKNKIILTSNLIGKSPIIKVIENKLQNKLPVSIVEMLEEDKRLTLFSYNILYAHSKINSGQKTHHNILFYDNIEDLKVYKNQDQQLKILVPIGSSFSDLLVLDSPKTEGFNIMKFK